MKQVFQTIRFHSRKIRLTKKLLLNIGSSIKNNDLKDFIAGMILHLRVDTWFHNSGFFKENVENSEMVLIDNAGHFIMLEKADELNQAIKEFINKYLVV